MATPNISNAVAAHTLPTESSSAASAASKKSAPAERAASTEKDRPSVEQIKHMVAAANKAMEKTSASLEFSVDSSTSKTVIKVTEAQSGKLIMQFPSEEMLAITRAIDNAQNIAQQGVLLKEKA